MQHLNSKFTISWEFNRTFVVVHDFFLAVSILHFYIKVDIWQVHQIYGFILNLYKNSSIGAGWVLGGWGESDKCWQQLENDNPFHPSHFLSIGQQRVWRAEDVEKRRERSTCVVSTTCQLARTNSMLDVSMSRVGVWGVPSLCVRTPYIAKSHSLMLEVDTYLSKCGKVSF